MSSGFFTKKTDKLPHHLPHPDFDITIILIIEEAIRYAWDRLIKSSPDNFDILSAKEDNITLALQKNLEDLRQDKTLDGFDGKTFETINRGGSLETYDGKKINKQPDLVFRLCGIRNGICRSEQDGIITECKPIDKKHSVGSCYCKKGISRFVGGQYAWAMNHCMMIGYVKGAYKIDPKLFDAVDKDEYNTIQKPFICSKTAELKRKPAVYITVHKRGWSYLKTGKEAQAIKIRHLWLIIEETDLKKI